MRSYRRTQRIANTVFSFIIGHVPLRCLKISNHYLKTSNKNASFSFFIFQTHEAFIFSKIYCLQNSPNPGSLLTSSYHEQSPQALPGSQAPSAFLPTHNILQPPSLDLSFSHSKRGLSLVEANPSAPALSTPLRSP